MTSEERALGFAKLALLLQWYRNAISDIVEETIREEVKRVFGCDPSKVNKVVFVRGVDKVLEELGITGV